MSEIKYSYSLKKLNLVKNVTQNTKKGKVPIDKPVSLLGAFEELNIFYDIDEIASSGNIVIKEQGNLIKAFPIVGLERLDIEFSIKSTSDSGNLDDKTSETYSHSFFVYSVDQMADKGDTKIYTVRFADLSALINVASRLEHRYIGKAEDIIKEICNVEMFTKHNIKNADDKSVPAMDVSIDTATRFELDMIAPSWKPFDFISKVASNAVSSNGNFNDCLFFQQTDGKFVFTDYLTLFKQNPIEFVKTPHVKPEVVSKYTINEYKLNRLYNTQSQSRIGMFGTVTKIVDFSNMSIHSFVNYYFKGDTAEKENPTYSALRIDDVKKEDNVPNYIDSLMEPYYPKNEKGDPRFCSIKQSPAACINIAACGFDQTSVQKMAGGGAVQLNDTPAYQTPRYVVANGVPCNLNMRTKSAIFFLNPCTDLKLGQPVTIKMAGNRSEKSDISTIEEFLNGQWYIGKIKYTLTLTNIDVSVECYSTSLSLL